MNNLPNKSLNYTPMQFLYGLDAMTPLDWSALNSEPSDASQDWITKRKEYRQEAMDAIMFAQQKMSYYYDQNHKPVEFKKNDKVYITLATGTNSGYRLPGATKLSERRVGPFKIISPVGRLAYRLELPPQWKIHPVVSVAYLEKHNEDPYDREAPSPPDIIQDDTGRQHEEYEVKSIIKKRFNKRRKRAEYYVKWKNYGSEHNTWEPRENLENSMDILSEFEATEAQTQAVSTLFLPAQPSPPYIPFYNATISFATT
jgi:hypothetical protein